MRATGRHGAGHWQSTGLAAKWVGCHGNGENRAAQQFNARQSPVIYNPRFQPWLEQMPAARNEGAGRKNRRGRLAVFLPGHTWGRALLGFFCMWAPNTVWCDGGFNYFLFFMYGFVQCSLWGHDAGCTAVDLS